MGTSSSKVKRNTTNEEAVHNPNKNIESSLCTAAYNPYDIWGNVFVLNNYCIGSESMNFVSNDGKGDQGVYLSFEHPRYRRRNFCDGTPWPLKMPFDEFDWDANCRTFKGRVDIKKNYGSGVTEKNEEGIRWYFWLEFDEHFYRVINGNKKSYKQSHNGRGNLINRINYGADHNTTYYNASPGTGKECFSAYIPSEAGNNPNDTWGNTFVLNSDSRGIGSESMHFVSSDRKGDQGVYLSFEHPRYRNMTLYRRRTLYRGKPWPLKMPFDSFRWNAKTRTFDGEVCIKKNYGSGVTEKNKHGGSDVEVTRWIFTLKFDEHFRRVIKGYKRSEWRKGFINYINDIHYGDYCDMTYYNASADPLIGIKGCTIDDAAYRGITLRQLLDVKHTIRCRCVSEKWRSANPNLSNKRLEPKDVTLYDLVEHLIKPITETRQCSYVEMIASKPQPPKWFVSHWWGEPVIEFIECLQGHARDRGLDLNTSYWICAYANNQWKADEEVGQDPEESSFYRAMKLSEGTVSILDREAVCYTRIWCSYELYLSFVEFSKDRSRLDDEESTHLYDAYTIGQNEKNGKEIAVGLTDGTVDVDNDEVRNQAKRQKSFPLEIANNALTVKIINAEASKPEDKTHILNSICGNKQGLNAEPPANHVKYDIVDSILRGRFASSMYRHMLDSGKNMELIRKALLDAPLSRVFFSFSDCTRFGDEASKFALSIPESLEFLDLDYAFMQFHSSEEFVVGFRRLRNLKMLKLSLANSRELSCINNLGEEAGTLVQLIELDLDFTNTKITKCGALAEMLNNLSQLKILRMNFSFCNKLPCINKLGEKIGTLAHLIELDLSFTENKINTCGALAEMLNNLSHLKVLRMNFNSCISISDISDLASSLATMTSIKKLRLNFCKTSLSNEGILELCRSVVKLDGLEYLFLYLNAIKPANGIVREKLVKTFQSIEDVKAALKPF